MNQLPIQPLTPEQQQSVMVQMYRLCAKQVQSYQQHRHMGYSSSVSMELARELMESIEYTIRQAGGVFTQSSAEESLRLGQEILAGKLKEARSLMALVEGTAPQWQTDCRWDALDYLRHYLERYDHLHLAHRGPEDLYYPILISPPEGIQGIDSCLFYLNILWIENRIMAAVPEEALEQFWNRLPSGTLNQCEHLLINGIGKALIGAGLSPLTFRTEEYLPLTVAMLKATEESLKAAAKQLCQWLDLADENAGMYVSAIIPQLTLWTGTACQMDGLENLFI